MNVFLDTNVLISAFVARGLCADIFRIILAEHELLISTYVLDELEHILDKKISLPTSQIQDIVQYLNSFRVTADHTPPCEINLRDKNDIPILAAALNSGADILVTGDKDLLEVSTEYNIKIVNPKAFLKIVRS